MAKHIYIARPRDPDESKRKSGERALESYRVDGSWVVDCFSEVEGLHLEWQYTFYGHRRMSRKTAERTMRTCQSIDDDLGRKRLAKKGRGK